VSWSAARRSHMRAAIAADLANPILTAAFGAFGYINSD
jgi:hypothetical protein